MKKFLQKKLNNEKGMTLIELLAVIVIIAIIAAIAIPAIGNIIENSRNGAVKSDYQNALAAANIYFTENNSAAGATVTVKVLAGNEAGANGVTTAYLEDQGSLADTAVVKKNVGGNAISGAAGDATTEAGTTTYQYNITSDTDGGLTNNELSGISNKTFTGTITAAN